ncbi:MAG: N-acetyltransferase family protein [Candidatus Sericytochromatia bacterium]
MALFEPYTPEVLRKLLPEQMLVRPAVEADLAGISLIHAQRYELDLEQAGEWAEKGWQRRGDNPWFVAVLGAQVVGYAHLLRFIPPPDAPPECVPAGWYLMGLTVAAPWRRHGIGFALSQARLEWLRDRCENAWYFANSLNRTSIALHAQLGFTEARSGIWFPGVEFSGGGIGLLFRVELLKQG